jgi:hypothetical protein
MSLSTEIERTKRGPNLEKRCWFNPNWYTVRSLGHGAVDLVFRSALYGWKAKTYA